MRYLTLAVIVGVFIIGSAPSPVIASGDKQIPTISAFIAIVSGYDAATIRRTFPAYNVGISARVFGAGEP